MRHPQSRSRNRNERTRGFIMSVRTIQDQAIARKTFVQQAGHADANAPAAPLRGAAMFSSQGKRGYASRATEGQYFEAVDVSSPPVIRSDATNLLRISWQLESIAKREGPRIAFKAKGSILLLNLFDIV